jgi:glycosyltransferase involved in cell wall biosynthesis
MRGIPQDALVFLYMARLTRDKGALLMAEGFSRLARAGVIDSHLLIVGPDEEGLRPRIAEICAGCRDRVHMLDYTRAPERLMSAADIFCMPSYREGFGTVFINAAAAGIPAIASRIYGSQEAVLDGITGLLHEAGNADDLAEKMRILGCNPTLRSTLGSNALVRVERDFSESAVTDAVLDFCATAIASRAPASQHFI